ncbi:MAG: beta-lactamase family protein [Devosia sp.]|uniref:serine hydrolase domain-containing protein n=1 Tax=Devosia sp. TaxID=1871048 RepID=UPI0024CC80DA|nr:serine hydrolase domain-containing protein [Devosia sp.]UYN98817.1 MAG: beta-lactamase family protein [Devosia sp.]
MPPLGNIVEGSVASAIEQGIPSSIAVHFGGEFYSHVHGFWPSGRAVEPSDPFYAASLAKQITGAAVACLVRDGRLAAGARASDILTEDRAWLGAITIGHLLHHTGGLPAAGVLEAMCSATRWTDELVFERLRQMPRLIDPGLEHNYSNAGYVVLARVVERISGLLFAEFVRQAILDPLGLGEMCVSARSGHPQSEQWGLLGPVLPLSRGDGGIWTTARAFVTWLQSQNSNELGLESLVTTDTTLRDGSPVGYGWGLGLRTFAGTRAYIHGGGWPGASAKIIRSPSLDLALVGLAAGPQAQSIQAVVDALYARLAGDAAPHGVGGMAQMS